MLQQWQDKYDRLIARCSHDFRAIIDSLEGISAADSISSADLAGSEHELRAELDSLISDGENLVTSTDNWRLRTQSFFQSAEIDERRFSAGNETMKIIEERWGNPKEYILALAEKTKMNSQSVAAYFVKPEAFERPMNNLLLTHYFETNENVRDTALRLGLKPASVRVHLSRFRLNASRKYLETHISESLDKEDLSYERNPDAALAFTIEYKARKFGIQSVVLSVVGRDKPFKSTPTNVRNSLNRAARDLDLGRPELRGYAGTAAVFMATGGEPFLMTYRQVSKLTEEHGDYLWRNPEEDLRTLASEDSTLLPAPDYISLLENAGHPWVDIKEG